MSSIATYVFLDLETTGLPKYESNKTKITELSMVAVQRRHILHTTIGLPRIIHKLTLCFNPGRMVDPVSTETTGLCNDLLEFEPYFTLKTCEMINSFLNNLQQPVCIIAHNGDRFDFPILKNHLQKFNSCFRKDIMCADSLDCFYDIFEGNDATDLGLDGEFIKETDSNNEHLNKLNHSNDLVEQKLMQLQNESTPKQKRTGTDYCNRPNKARRCLFWEKGSKPRNSYKLEDIYKRVVGCEPINAHQAECDCIMALHIAVTLKEQFVEWVDKNCHSFSEIQAMTIGIPM